MPVATSYPGVYVQEIASGVRTITGVATSITAFIGRAPKGSTADPVLINSFGDFQRNFGGLDPNYPLGYAVNDFYQNGGSQALIVRLYKKKAGAKDTAVIALTNLPLQAVSPGAWANQLRVRVDYNVSSDIATRYNLTTADLFNLTIKDVASGSIESFLNVTVKESPRRVDRVLASGSSLLEVAASLTLPANLIPPKSGDPAPGDDVWAKDVSSTGVAQADRASDSDALDLATYTGDPVAKTGIYTLKKADLFNLLCIPPDVRDGDTDKAVYSVALDFCVARRAMLLVDPPAAWTSANAVAQNNGQALTSLGMTGDRARNAALFFPRVIEADPQRGGQPDTFVPCGIVAGVFATTDSNRGVWKAPAGIDAGLSGVQGLSVSLTNEENGQLNPMGVNCLRNFPIVGPVVWGARTLRGADLLADDYKYLSVRRTAFYIEESLYRGLQWVVFEPNDEPLWAQVRLNVGAFMHNMFRLGAFQGASPKDAYFVKCDKDTTTQNDIDLGVVNVVVGFAPLKPAEFVIIQLQQIAGQLSV